MMRKYEVTLVLKPKTTKENQEKLLGHLKKWLGKGKILSTANWGKKDLAYPIEKEKQGVYLFLEIEMETKKGGELKKRLRLEDDVLRHLLVKQNLQRKGTEEG